MGWHIDAGPLHFSDKGVAVKPQLKVGYADSNVNVRAGIEDVRNGISAAVAGHVHRVYDAEGNGIQRVLQELKNESNIKILDDLISAAPKLLAQAMKTAHVRIADNCPVWAKMIVKGGVGVSGTVCLGWANTDGFHMIGVQGAASAAVGIGADMMIGRHSSKSLVKYILGLPNLCMELLLEHGGELTEHQIVALEEPTADLMDNETEARDALTMTV